MKPSFDQRLKQQLEQSSPEDLGYRPDRDKLWSRIEAKQKRQTLPLRLWVSHAAAIAAGLVVGSYFLTTYNRHEDPGGVKQIEQATTGIVPEQHNDSAPTVTVAPKVRDEAVQQQPLPGLQQHPAPIGKPSQMAGTAQQPATQKTAMGQSPQLTNAAPVQEQAPVIAQAAQPKAKVLHLMDIDNENTRVMRQSPEHNMTWAWMLPANRVESNQASFSEQLGQHLFHIKN